jgi:hypothetical protein
MLSVAHSGLTMYTLFFDFVFKNLCVADAFSESCDVTICVAPEAVCLDAVVYRRIIEII